MADESNSDLASIAGEVKTAMLGRFNSPFLGAFIVSWLVWNHRLVFVLFSGLSVPERFRYIDETLYPTVETFLCLNVGGPLLSALAYIFLLPWPTEWVHKWNLHRKQRLWYAEQVAEGKRLLTHEESQTIRAENLKLKSSLNQRRQELVNSETRAATLAMLGLDRLKRDALERVHTAYLTSQPFIIEGSGSQVAKKIIFRDEGAAEFEGSSGNVRWSFHEGKVHLYDADQEKGRLGHVQFNQSSLAFEGQLTEFGHVRIKGAYSARAFAG